MMQATISVYLVSDNIFTWETDFNSAKRAAAAIAVRGYAAKDAGRLTHYPPHQIDRIEIVPKFEPTKEETT